MKLSDQAMGALMLILQKCLMEQSDITDLMRQLDFAADDDGVLTVTNPPMVRDPRTAEYSEDEATA
jgi:hypothetical protein